MHGDPPVSQCDASVSVANTKYLRAFVRMKEANFKDSAFENTETVTPRLQTHRRLCSLPPPKSLPLLPEDQRASRSERGFAKSLPLLFFSLALTSLMTAGHGMRARWEIDRDCRVHLDSL